VPNNVESTGFKLTAMPKNNTEHQTETKKPVILFQGFHVLHVSASMWLLMTTGNFKLWHYNNV
jgi:hypothetical protein